jgi:hypothetical protein
MLLQSEADDEQTRTSVGSGSTWIQSARTSDRNRLDSSKSRSQFLASANPTKVAAVCANKQTSSATTPPLLSYDSITTSKATSAFVDQTNYVFLRRCKGTERTLFLPTHQNQFTFKSSQLWKQAITLKLHADNTLPVTFVFRLVARDRHRFRYIDLSGTPN